MAPELGLVHARGRRRRQSRPVAAGEYAWMKRSFDGIHVGSLLPRKNAAEHIRTGKETR